jgi:hypothetical protein
VTGRAMRRRAALVVMLAAAGCGGSVAASKDGAVGPGSDSGDDSCNGVPGIAAPPVRPRSSSSTPLLTPHNYALQQLFLGDTDRQGNLGATAWQSLGYDLDGKATSACSTDVCTLTPGASRQVQVDGNGGIDNSWGANFVPVLLMVDPDGPMQINRELEGGDWTWMTYVDGFDDSAGNTTTATGLTGVQLLGASYPGGPPAFDWTTNWPVDPSSVQGCSYPAGCAPGTSPLLNALTKFDGAFQTGGTFVSGAPQLFTLPLSIGGMRITLNIHAAYLTFAPDFPGAVTDGTVAGAILASDLADQLAQPMMPSLCQGTVYQSVITQIEQMADIVLSADGTTLSNPAGVPCNAISLGLGFDADEIAIPTDIALPTPPQPDSCPDAG